MIETRRLLWQKSGLRLKVLLLWCIKRKAAIITSWQGRSTSASRKKLLSACYTRATDTPLSLFITANEGDLTALARTVAATNEQLQEAFAMLQAEFCQLIKSHEYTNMVGLYAQLTQISNKTMKLTMLLNMQERGQDVSRAIKTMTGRNTPAAQLANWEMQRVRILNAINQKDKKTDNKPTDYNSLITDIEIWAKKDIDAEKIAVAKFAAYVVKYRSWIDAQKKQAKKR